MGVLFNRDRPSLLSEERSLATVEVMAVRVSLLPVAGIKDPDEGSLGKGYWDHSLKEASIMVGGHGGRSMTGYVTSAIRKPRELKAMLSSLSGFPAPGLPTSRLGRLTPINLN